jgi:hypothetical protein
VFRLFRGSGTVGVRINAIELFKTALLSFTMVGLSFWLQGNVGLNFADEGSLWYGAKHTALGKVPLMDIHSYDPGRYYWAAFWSYFFGDGIIALRISTGIFQFIGLTLGLLAARRVVNSWWVLACVGLLLLVWMQPHYRHFEPSLAMAGIFFAVLLIENPSLLRHFSAGVFVGIAAFFGRNHGLYMFLAFSLLILFIWFKTDRSDLIKRQGIWMVGFVTGYSPMLFMLIFIPGFFDSFIYSMQWLVSNFYKPIPWLWKADSQWYFYIGLLFLLMPLFYLLSIIGFFLADPSEIRRCRLLLASTFVGIFYTHHAFSRADLYHLTAAIHPFLLGLTALPGALRFDHKKAAVASLAVFFFSVTFITAGTANPYYQYRTMNDKHVQYNILGDNLWVLKLQASFLDDVKSFATGHVAPDEGLLIFPYWPSLYCILERESPVWQIYVIAFPGVEAPAKFQKEMIEDIEAKNVNWAIIGDVGVDGREELRFSNTHRHVWQYLTASFEIADLNGQLENYLLLHRKENP